MKECDSGDSAGITVRDRLLSIKHDAEYVDKLRESFPDFPVIPNERCGSWYVRPALYADSNVQPVYFKSTDGHEGEWSFSTRRLNMHLLKVLSEHGGALVVDSTRRERKIPDSFSKTVPIWAAVVNEAVHGRGDWLRTPREVVSLEEEERIRELLPTFCASFRNVRDRIPGGVPVCPPVRVFWVYPGSEVPTFGKGECDFVPLVLVTASDVGGGGGECMSEGYMYVAGAGDDHEMWAGELTPESFWACNSDSKRAGCVVHDVHDVNRNISFGRLDSGNCGVVNSESFREFTKVIVLDPYFACDSECEWIVQVPAVSGTKPGARMLRRWLDRIVLSVNEEDRVLVLCGRGDDLAVGVVLCLLNRNRRREDISKISIRGDFVELSRFGRLNPQRATLNAVHEYLLKR